MAAFNPFDSSQSGICPSCRRHVVPGFGGCLRAALYIGGGAVIGSIIPLLGTLVGMVLGWIAHRRTRYCPACGVEIDMRDFEVAR
jgi:hypothetical protein